MVLPLWEWLALLGLPEPQVQIPPPPPAAVAPLAVAQPPAQSAGGGLAAASGTPAAPADAPATGTGAADAEAPTCPDPRYTYSNWELVRTEREYEGEWVVEHRHYRRTRTDQCDGSTTTQTKTETEQLWPSRPSERISDVNEPRPGSKPVTGRPLPLPPGSTGSEEPQVGPSLLPPAGAGGAGGAADTDGADGTGKTTAPGVPLPFLPAPLLFMGLLAGFLHTRLRFDPDETGNEADDGMTLFDPQQALAEAKQQWWEARFRDDQDGMDAAHKWASFLRDHMGAQETEELNAAVNSPYEYWWQVLQGEEPDTPPPPDPYGAGELARELLGDRHLQAAAEAWEHKVRGEAVPADLQARLDLWQRFVTDEVRARQADIDRLNQRILDLKQERWDLLLAADPNDLTPDELARLQSRLEAISQEGQRLREKGATLPNEWLPWEFERQQELDRRYLEAARESARLWGLVPPDNLSEGKAHYLRQARSHDRYLELLKPYVSDPEELAARLQPLRTPGSNTPEQSEHSAVQLEPLRHEVGPGDTLAKLADFYLGDPTRYPEIAELNGLSNPNMIYPGQVLLIPQVKADRVDLDDLRNLPPTKRILIGDPHMREKNTLTPEVPQTIHDAAGSVVTEEFDPGWSIQKKVAFWKPHALEAQSKTGVPWQVTLGQFGHESMYGSAIPPGSYNVFGATADNETDPNKYVIADTEEGSGTRIKRKFRKYTSYSDSFADHLRILTENAVYEDAFEYSDPYQFLAMIWVGNVSAGYATDPYYVEKVAAHIFRMETGRYRKEDWPLTYDSDQNSNNGEEVVHVFPKKELLSILQERLYGNPTIRSRLIERHKYLYRYSTQRGIAYPKEVWMGTEWVYVGD